MEKMKEPGEERGKKLPWHLNKRSERYKKEWEEKKEEGEKL